MLLLIPVLLLLLAPVALWGVRSVRNGYAYQWLIAVSSLLLVLAYLLFLRRQLPVIATFTAWQPGVLFPVPPTLFLDSVSWLFAIVVVIVALAVLLTAVTRLVVGNWLPWAGTLALAAISLLAVMAGGPLMLLLAWAALDLVDLWLVLVQVRSSTGREHAVIALSARIAGMGFLVWAMLSAKSAGVTLNFASIPANVSLYLLLAGGLRLGVIPLQPSLLGNLPTRRGYGTSLRMLPTASSLLLLVRAANVGVEGNILIFLLLLTSIAGLYSSLSWLLAKDVLAARPFWILGMASLAVIASIKGDSQASQAWGLALLLAGSYIFLLAPNHNRLVVLGIPMLMSIAALPFSLTWSGAAIYTTGQPGWLGGIAWLVNFLLFLSHACLLSGFIKYVLQTPTDQPSLERWMWLVYPLGLVALVVTSLILGWVYQPEIISVPWYHWGVGLLTLAAAVGAWWWGTSRVLFQPIQDSLRRGSDWSATTWAYILSMQWLYWFAWQLYRGLRRILWGFTHILEGDGGLLWAFVLLGLIWSLFLG